MLEITVHDIKGNCPVHQIGDKIIIQNPEINLDETDALCTHALPAILHYVLILEHKWCPFELGLTKENDPENAYIQCLDPGQPYTDGGTVIFKIKKNQFPSINAIFWLPAAFSLVFNPQHSSLCLRLKTRSGLAGNQNLPFLDGN